MDCKLPVRALALELQRSDARPTKSNQCVVAAGREELGHDFLFCGLSGKGNLRMTITRLASVLRVSPNTIVAWERGQKAPRDEVAKRLAVLAAGVVDGEAKSYAWLLPEQP